MSNPHAFSNPTARRSRRMRRQPAPRCASCGPEMEEGYVLDTSAGGGRKAEWVRGSTVPRLRLRPLPPHFETGPARFTIRALRCPVCGRLEFYAS